MTPKIRLRSRLRFIRLKSELWFRPLLAVVMVVTAALGAGDEKRIAAHVGFGSLADIDAPSIDVRFAPNSGHASTPVDVR